MKNKISIIIPVYNAESSLSKCLDSILCQDFNLKEIEVIIINDGSTDNSESIVKKYLKKMNCKYVLQENKGQSTARNEGLKIASGDYITFLDSDDYISKNMLSKMYAVAYQEKLDIVTCDLAKVKRDKITHIHDQIDKDEKKNFVLTKTGPCNMLISKKFLKQINFEFPNNLTAYEDIAVIPLLGMKKNVKIKHLNEALYFYNDSPNSIMNQNSYNVKLNNIFMAMDMLLKSAQKEENYNLYKNEIEYLFIRHLIMSAGLRYIRFGDPENKIREIKLVMEKEFPCWEKNPYYLKSSRKLKITAKLVMNNKKKIIKVLDIIRRKK